MHKAMLRCGIFGMLLCRNVGSHWGLLRYIKRQNKVTGRNAKINREFIMAYNSTISQSNVPTIKAPFAVIGGFFAAIWNGLSGCEFGPDASGDIPAVQDRRRAGRDGYQA